jgi:hypothetical protein
MQLPPADHPLWPLLRVSLMIVALGLCLALNYESPFDEIKDIRAMIIMAIVTSGVEYGKRALCRGTGNGDKPQAD